MLCAQLPQPGTLTCRLTIPAAHLGLNVSIFDGALCSNDQSVDIADEAVADPPGSTGSVDHIQPTLASLQAICSPKSAIASSGNGVYIVRPVGASLQNIDLPAGVFLLVPSTFDPASCKYEFTVFISPIALCSMQGFGIKRIR